MGTVSSEGLNGYKASAMKKDIEDIRDIKSFVDLFYEKIREDDLLGGIFNAVIKENWEPHLEKMYRFWQTLLFKERTYFGQPFPPHQHMALSAQHFDRWTGLFTTTIDELFEGEMATEAKLRANTIAGIFNAKLNPGASPAQAAKSDV